MSGPPEVSPRDQYNEILLANVHPPDWVNPTPAPSYNLVVTGGGTAGLGAKVALVERHLLGGDCLNYGCVPSKASIRSSRAAADLKDAARFGLTVPPGIEVDFAAVMERLRRPKNRAFRFRPI